MPAFSMRDYITVAERLTQSQDELAHLQTDPPVMLTESVGYVRVTITLKSSRTATGVGGFRLDLQGKGPEVTDPLEKAETTAIGRALKHLGYGVSREEMERIAHNQQAEQAPPARPTMTVQEAERRFWGKYKQPLGGQEWARVVGLIGEWPQPITLDEWIAVGKAVNAALAEEDAKHQMAEV